MVILEMVHHAQIGQASIFKQTQVILIESDLNATTDDVQNKEIKRTISFSILVNWKKKSVTLIQNNLYFQGQIKPFLKKCMNMEKKILH